jgi:hypothetical protein
LSKKFVKKLNGQLCPSKYTKWTLSISSEMERIRFRAKGELSCPKRWRTGVGVQDELYGVALGVGI